MTKIRVVVADDHALFRDGLCALLALTPDIEVVGEASTGKEAMERVRELCPDVVIMDIEMPVMDGLEACRRIHERSPVVKLVVVSHYEDRDHVLDAVDAGALGFIEKTACSTELTTSIRAVYAGDSFLSPAAARLLVDEFRSKEHRARDDPYLQLSDREREVLRLIAEGYHTQEIADLLVLSPKTVEGHRTSLMAKLGLHDRVDLVKFAIRKGVIKI